MQELGFQGARPLPAVRRAGQLHVARKKLDATAQAARRLLPPPVQAPLGESLPILEGFPYRHTAPSSRILLAHPVQIK
jgi:hypothetical protein